MKTKLALLALIGLSTIQAQLSTAFAQGSLTPPSGTPAPVMKSLDQIEARFPISSAPYSITNPGSYYFTTNLTVSSGDGITIFTNNVSLDMNGWTLASTAISGGGVGILIKSRTQNLTIQNGFIRGTTVVSGGSYTGGGFNYGICYEFEPSLNTRVQGVTVSGCPVGGIYLNASSSIVESCIVNSTAGLGIRAGTIRDSVAANCLGSALEGDRAINCRGESYNVGSAGIQANVASDSTGVSVNGAGLRVKIANNCVGIRTNGTAIDATVANGCYALVGTNIITYKYNMP